MVVKEYTESGALVVGGSSGIGLQTACHLAAAGVPRIALAGRDRRRLDAAAATVRDHGDVDVVGVAFDAADPAAAAAGIEEAESHLRGIDVLVCSVASNAEPDLLHDIAPEEILGVVSGQLLPPLVTTRLVVPGMYRRGGRFDRADRVRRGEGGNPGGEHHRRCHGRDRDVRADGGARGQEARCPHQRGDALARARDAHH